MAVATAVSLLGAVPVSARSDRDSRQALAQHRAFFPHALQGGRLDYYWDDFAASPGERRPGLLPLVAGTRADVELRLRAPIRLTGATLTVRLPGRLGARGLHPAGGVGGDPAEVDPSQYGAVTVRPADYFPFDGAGLRPRGHCRPVPGTAGDPGHTVTPSGAGWRLRVPGVTCRSGQLLRLRVYGVQLPSKPRALVLPWVLRDGSRVVGGLEVLRVVRPSRVRLEVDAPQTHQLEVSGSGTTGSVEGVTVRAARPNGRTASRWTGWVDVTADLFRRDTFPCQVVPRLVRFRPGDRGVVHVPPLTVSGSVPAQPQVVLPDFPDGLPAVPAYVNAWALDRSVRPGSDGPVEALPPPGWDPTEPIFPSLECPTSYH